MRFQLALAAALLASSVPVARAADLTVALAVRDGGFEPAVVQVPASARVRIEVTNQTPVAIEFESFDLNRERVVQPGQTAAVYVSGLKPGRYQFFDDFHQQRRGTLLVE
ncbi:MAG TPA: cupredoxin domain-containing protein [Candidatus Binatia bacterium]|nr:cupredoxin domain-containing protein [Candidatus Binatia bacterium]